VATKSSPCLGRRGEPEVQPIGLRGGRNMSDSNVSAAGQPGHHSRNHSEREPKNSDPVLSFSVFVVNFPGEVC